MNKKYVNQIVIAVFLTLTAFQCEKDYPVVNEIEVLNDFNISIQEEQIDYKVGDTIWLTAQINEHDLFNSSGLEVMNNGIGYVHFFILKLRKYRVQVGAENFDILYPNKEIQDYVADGYFLNPRTYVTRIADIEYKDSTYYLNVGLIPKSAADYCFYLQSASISFGELFEESYEFNLSNIHFSVNNSNKEIVAGYEYTERIWVGNTQEQFSLPLDEKSLYFAFRVTE
jgi:hypothetical protein